MERDQMTHSEASNVELADTAMLAQLLDRAVSAGTSRTHRAERRSGERRAQRRRCTCGKCRVCLDNARWEMVFQQKFADPYYYSLHPPRQGSSLNGF
jgi:hypothetical protein